MLVAGLLLASLWIFAGRVRQPGGMKHRWAVLASRMLVVAGGVFCLKLLMFSHEERIPVLFFRSRVSRNGHTRTLLDHVKMLRARGYEDIPLYDVTMFIRQNRYVPKNCFGVVVEACSQEDIDGLIELGKTTHVTSLLTPAVLDKGTPVSFGALPEKVSLAVVLEQGKDVLRRLEARAKIAEDMAGRRPDYALTGKHMGSDAGQILRSSGLRSFLDGNGYNRFGDESHAVRLMDVSSLTTGKASGLGLRLYIALYKGRYLAWPLVAVGRLLGMFQGEG